MLRFDWDEDNLQHIVRHSVTAEEAELVLTGPTFELEVQDWHDEEWVSEAGATMSGIPRGESGSQAPTPTDSVQVR